jgi:hypothetical protein
MKDIIILEIARDRDDLIRLGYDHLWAKYGERTLDLLYPSKNQAAPIPIKGGYTWSFPLACVVGDFLVRVPCRTVRRDEVTDTWWMREDDWTEFVT